MSARSHQEKFSTMKLLEPETHQRVRFWCVRADPFRPSGCAEAPEAEESSRKTRRSGCTFWYHGASPNAQRWSCHRMVPTKQHKRRNLLLAQHRSRAGNYRNLESKLVPTHNAHPCFWCWKCPVMFWVWPADNILGKVPSELEQKGLMTCWGEATLLREMGKVSPQSTTRSPHIMVCAFQSWRTPSQLTEYPGGDGA